LFGGSSSRVLPLSTAEEDLYTSAFKYLHRRDLYLMVKVLHANAVMLEPWDAKDSFGMQKSLLQSKDLKGAKMIQNGNACA